MLVLHQSPPDGTLALGAALRVAAETARAEVGLHKQSTMIKKGQQERLGSVGRFHSYLDIFFLDSSFFIRSF